MMIRNAKTLKRSKPYRLLRCIYLKCWSWSRWPLKEGWPRSRLLTFAAKTNLNYALSIRPQIHVAIRPNIKQIVSVWSDMSDNYVKLNMCASELLTFCCEVEQFWNIRNQFTEKHKNRVLSQREDFEIVFSNHNFVFKWHIFMWFWSCNHKLSETLTSHTTPAHVQHRVDRNPGNVKFIWNESQHLSMLHEYSQKSQRNRKFQKKVFTIWLWDDTGGGEGGCDSEIFFKCQIKVSWVQMHYTSKTNISTGVGHRTVTL